LWRDLDRKVRNQVRKAQKSNLTTHAGGHELVDEFYAVFAENMRDLGTPVYSQQLFSSICTTFPDSARVHLVRLGQRTIAGALSYAFKDTMEVPSASSLREFRPLCPNHLMYWSILSEAIERKHARFDFGRSTPDDGTYHFKEQWGALPEALCWEYALVSADRVPDEDRHNAKFRATIQAWKRLPLAVANRVGPWIARGIP
jgi:serine/alanine adding enzyme